MDLNAEMLNLKAWKPCLLLFWPALCLHALQQNNSSVCRLASAQVGSWSSLSLARRDPVARPSVESLLSLQSCQDTWKLSQRFCLFPVSMTPISLHSSPIHLGGDSEERGERKGCLGVRGWLRGNTQRGQEVKGWEVADELHDGPRSAKEKELSSLVPAVLYTYMCIMCVYICVGLPWLLRC